MDFTMLDTLLALLKDFIAMFTKFIDGLRNKEIVFDKEIADGTKE